MRQQTLLLAINLWQQSRTNQLADPNLLTSLQNALKRYIFPALGWETANLKTKEFANFCSNLQLEKFTNALHQLYQVDGISLKLIEQNQKLSYVPSPREHLTSYILVVFDYQFSLTLAARQITQSTRKNYRSALGQFFRWLEQQSCEYLAPELASSIALVKSPRKEAKTESRSFDCYALAEQDIPDHLRNELENFKQFWTGQDKHLTYGQQQGSCDSTRQRPLISRVSSDNFDQSLKPFILRFLGWCVIQYSYQPAMLHLKLLADSQRIQQYNTWMLEERQATYGTGIQLTCIGIAVAKWLYLDQVKRQNWSTVEAIVELRSLRKRFEARYKRERKYAELDTSVASLSCEQLRQICQYFRQNCAIYSGTTHSHADQRIQNRKRPPSAILQAWQTALIVEIFAHLTIQKRQFILCQSGWTLSRTVDERGSSIYTVCRNEDTQSYPLPGTLTTSLDTWIQVHRLFVQQAVQTPYDWLAFWGHKLDELNRLHARLIAAKHGEIQSNVKDTNRYIKHLQDKVAALEHRIAVQSVAKQNIEALDTVFFHFGSKHPEMFGQPLTKEAVRSSVTNAIKKATQEMFEQTVRFDLNYFYTIATWQLGNMQQQQVKLSESFHSQPANREQTA